VVEGTRRWGARGWRLPWVQVMCWRWGCWALETMVHGGCGATMGSAAEGRGGATAKDAGVDLGSVPRGFGFAGDDGGGLGGARVRHAMVV